MILHEKFIERAKSNGSKMAIIDGTTGKKVIYSKALIATFLFADYFKKVKDDFIGLMIPTSAGGYLANMGVLACGKVPVLINYSTGLRLSHRYV